MTPPRPAEASQSPVEDELDVFGLNRREEEWFEIIRQASDVEPLGQLGQYELLSRVGRGGQGMVYQARQPVTKRLVAIKHLWAGSFATTVSRARFEREIEAASALSHPNIVRVYGTEMIDGQQVLTMEWIDGKSIDDWAAHEGPRSVRQLLEVFSMVCEAVSHAHRNGVLHRDLKPSNILVDADHQPHVLDFGLAKLTSVDGQPVGDLSITQGTGFMGTPAYASPEQISGDQHAVDARSDVYALGVILYQMLTGELPHGTSRTLPEIFDAIRKHDPQRPSNVRRDLNREVDAIVLKALEKEPERRYQTVDALAADVRRFLSNQTVLAHPPSAAYQTRKFISRHRTMVTAVVCIIAALAIGLVVSVSALLRVIAAQRDIAKSRRSAEHINAFLNRTLASADPASLRGEDFTIVAMLHLAQVDLDSGALADEPLAQADVRLTIGDAFQSIGLYPEASAQYQKACDLREQHLSADAPELAAAMATLARLLIRTEEFHRATPLVDRVVEIRRKAFGEQHREYIDALAIRAKLYSSQGQVQQAEDILCALLQSAIRAEGGEENDFVAQIKVNLAYVGACTNKNEDRAAMFRDALETERRLHGEMHEHVAYGLLNLGAVERTLGDFALAEAHMSQALELHKKMYGEDHSTYANTLYNLGSVYLDTERYDLSEAAYRQALAIDERRLPAGHYNTARARYRLGRVLAVTGRFNDAEPLLRQAIAELDNGMQNREVVGVAARQHLADGLTNEHRFEEAERLLLEAFQIMDRIRSDPLLDIPKGRRDVIGRLMKLYQEWDKPDQANRWKSELEGTPTTGP